MPNESDETEEVQISVSGIPTALLNEIDRLAEKEDRPRAAYIRRLLSERVAEIKAEQAKKKAA